VPLLSKQSQQLIRVLRRLHPPQIAQLMDLSDALAGLNVARYQAWRAKSTRKTHARHCWLLMATFTMVSMHGPWTTPRSTGHRGMFAYSAACMGFCALMDLMQPYRLEMGTRLPTSRGKDLYAFWGDAVTNYLNTRLVDLADPVLSTWLPEYFKWCQPKRLEPVWWSVCLRTTRAGTTDQLQRQARAASE
jgi:cytoplasmic iron level regulating protein YaaA (DUF328/UPF0246 family)